MSSISTSAPAVVYTTPTHLDMYLLGPDGKLLQKSHEGTTWSPSIGDGWVHLSLSLPASITATPAVVAWNP